MKTTALITVDVEEWWMAENVRPFVHREERAHHSSILALEALLQFFSDRNVTATLFVVADLCRSSDYVRVLKRAVIAGHEIACHSMSHKLLDGLSYDETVGEVLAARQLLESTLGVEVVGFRSPCFSSNKNLEGVLIEAGFSYTSNGISASFHDRYGNSSANESLPDLKIPSANILGFRIPATGGGWFRLLPILAQRFFIRKAEPFVFYCHPWDFDANQPYLSRLPPITRFRHAVNNSKGFQRLPELLDSDFEFSTCRNYLERREYRLSTR